MNSRFFHAAGLAALLAGCAVPVGQIRNGRFVSADHGSLRVRNQTIAFDLHDLPPGARVKKRVPYRLRPDGGIELSLRLPEEYRAGAGAYAWRLVEGEIIATDRRDRASTVIFSRPHRGRVAVARAEPAPRPAELEPLAPAALPAGDAPVPILLE